MTTKVHLLAEGRGRSLVKRLTAGQAADTKEPVALLEAYGSKANRRSLRARGIPHTIPERADVRANRARKGSRGGQPPNFNAARYKDRNQVERAFNRLKQFRAVATRYDKLKCRYQATITVASIVIWLRAKPDRTTSRSVR
ncbi:transposase [Dactylosporangium sp. NPDC049140]|uniref:transposase n=1 Tax=Dactylosporangium sp. NPDC049140 TaxID=3155647 RepID=UPI0033C4F8FE